MSIPNHGHKVKALSIHQPYAELIRSKAKTIENRSFPIKYRGPLIIQASKTSNYLEKHELAKYDTMGVVCAAILCGCVNKDDALAGKIQKVPETVIERLKTDVHAEGPYCWFLDSIKPLEFVPMKGAQGLFDPKPEDWENIHKANPDLMEWIEYMLGMNREAQAPES